MERVEVLDRVVRDHTELQEYLRQWEAALMQLSAVGFHESQRGLQRLWGLLPFLDTELPRHFNTEEVELFPAVRARHPDSNSLVSRFLKEHAELAHQYHAYQQELLHCEDVQETGCVHELATAWIARLRQHMQDEEQALLPLVE